MIGDEGHRAGSSVAGKMRPRSKNSRQSNLPGSYQEQADLDDQTVGVERTGVRPSVPVAWEDVWSLYLEHAGTFSRVIARLRYSGLRIETDTGNDLIHQFLIDHARDALATYQPELGLMAPWLAVVFRRYAVRQLRTEEKRRALLQAWECAFAKPLAFPALEDHTDLERILSAFKALEAAERRALVIFFADGSHSIRAVATALNLSRWRAQQLLLLAAAKVHIFATTAKSRAPEAHDSTTTDDKTRRLANHLIRFTDLRRRLLTK